MVDDDTQPGWTVHATPTPKGPLSVTAHKRKSALASVVSTSFTTSSIAALSVTSLAVGAAMMPAAESKTTSILVQNGNGDDQTPYPPYKKVACNPCNPCGAAKACNPCNPCGAKKACNPCNPCAADWGASSSNPCAAQFPDPCDYPNRPTDCEE